MKLLSEARAHECLALVVDIAEQLMSGRYPATNAGLAGGTAGLAVFFAYLARELGPQAGAGYAEHAMALLDDAIAHTPATMPAFYAGYPGVAWAVAHLEGRLFERGEDDPVGDTDDALLEWLQRSPWKDDYDLISGLVGAGVYTLERRPRPRAMECLELIVGHLRATAEAAGEGVTWFTPLALVHPTQRDAYPRGYYNYGLAHGVPGIVAFLARLVSSELLLDVTAPLLRGATRWLLARRQDPNVGSNFPVCLAPGEQAGHARAAWCYGDPGVGIALLAAARALHDGNVEREALDVLRSLATRPFETCAVADTALCHGASGLMHIYARVFRATGDEACAAIARSWLDITLRLRRSDGVAGFFYHENKTGEPPRIVPYPGLLMGAAGTGLALLGMASELEPTWDRFLLCSIVD